jgi:hypothetical protein
MLKRMSYRSTEDMIRSYKTLGDVMKAMNCGKMPDLDTAMAMRKDAVRMVEAEEAHAGLREYPQSTPVLLPPPFGSLPLTIFITSVSFQELEDGFGGSQMWVRESAVRLAFIRFFPEIWIIRCTLPLQLAT